MAVNKVSERQMYTNLRYKVLCWRQSVMSSLLKVVFIKITYFVIIFLKLIL